MLHNSLVISRIHHPAIFINGMPQNLITTLEKQLNFGVKAWFKPENIYSSSDFNKKPDMFPI